MLSVFVNAAIKSTKIHWVACIMWSFASTAGGSTGSKDSRPIPVEACSDDEVSTGSRREEGLECPICWESFNIVENIPYVLWCGHTLCKNCVLGLQWAVVKFPTLPVQLPLFISCPWCNMLSFRLVYKGSLKFPRKNFFLLWMVENMNGDRSHTYAPYATDHHVNWLSNSALPSGNRSSHGNDRSSYSNEPPHESQGNVGHIAAVGEYLSVNRLRTSLQKSLVYLVHLTSKFPLIVILLLIILYAVPASAAILTLYIVVTIVFALPSFLILYFAYPSLDWLVKEILS